jgi:hypothetical protein
LSFERKLEVIKFYWENKGYLTLEQMVQPLRALGFSTICATTIRRCVDREAQTRRYVASGEPSRLSAKRELTVCLPEVEAALIEWVKQKLSNHVRLTGDIICEKARHLCVVYRVESKDMLSFSHGWLESFKRRHGLREIVFHGERASVPQERIGAERNRLRVLLQGYPPRDVLNVDETALFSCAAPSRGIGTHESGGVKSDKTRMTYVFCSNMDGSYKRAPLIIGHAKHPLCFERHRSVADYGFDYHNNKNAWMTGDIWQK